MDSSKIAISALMTTLRIVVTVVVIIVIYRGAMTAYDYGYRLFAEGPMGVGDGQSVTVYIPEGAGVGEIGDILVANGLVKDSKLFYLQNLISAHRNDLKSGVYELSTGMDAFDIMEVLGADEEVEE